MPHDHAGKEITYSISELAQEFDITARTIRYYEDEGLISPTREGQNRIYSHKDKIRLKLTLRGKRLGFSLAEIRELFDMYDTDRSSRTQLLSMVQLIEAKREALRQQQEDIQMVLAELEAAERRCSGALDLLAARDGQPRSQTS
ncbi:MerR family transcriptional regulator [Aeromonas bivalvium]|uniref:MerR family transcriptional regulator n=1 Tax=Aeromonas TaxID=642 RepID=UPI0038D14E8F